MEKSENPLSPEDKNVEKDISTENSINFDDAEFMREMRKIGKDNVAMLEGMEFLSKQIALCARLSGVDTIEQLFGNGDGNLVVEFINGLAMRPNGKTEMLTAIRLSLIAAFRFSRAAIDGLDKIANPEKGDSDDPVLL